MELPLGVKFVRTLRGHTDIIWRIAWSQDGHLLASPSDDGIIRLWDAETGKCLRTLEGHKGGPFSIAFDPQGGTLASGGADKTVKLWDVDSGRLLRTFEGHDHIVSIVAFDPQGGILASGSADMTVKLWDVDSGHLLHMFKGHDHPIYSIAFAPQARILASASLDKTVKLWAANSGRLLNTLEGHQNGVLCVTFDPQGRILASASLDNTVKLWSVDSGLLLRTIEGHIGCVTCIAFESDGQLMASKSCDDTIRLWSSSSGSCIAVIPEPTSANMISGLAFHPRRPWLATVGSDPGTWPRIDRNRIIHIWELDMDVLLRQAAAPTILPAPTMAAVESVAEQIENTAKAGRQTQTWRSVIEGKKAQRKFDVFVSYNSKDEAAVEQIAQGLLKVGLRPWLAKWDLAAGDTISDALEQAIETIPCAALCFGPADVGDWHIMEIRAYVEAWAKKKARMVPLILPGVEKPQALPLFVRQTLWVDMRDWQNVKSDAFYRLVCGILGRAPGNSPPRQFGVRDVIKWQAGLG